MTPKTNPATHPRTTPAPDPSATIEASAPPEDSVAETFVRGNDRLAELLERPGLASRVGEVQAGAREMDRIHADGLAAIRRAGDRTQVEVARRLGIGQGGVSRLEHRDDMLLSTLADYLRATGARQPRIVVTLDGIEVELDLDHLRAAR